MVHFKSEERLAFQCNTVNCNLQIGQGETFTFASLPQPVWTRCQKYSTQKMQISRNMMWDPRVRRGNPSRPPIRKQCQFIPTGQVTRIRAIRSPKFDYKKAFENVPKVSDIDIQTDALQEKYEDVQVEPEFVDMSIQTSFFDRREEEGEFFQKVKVGVDAATEILPGELFDFDLEMAPLVDSLVSMIIEEGLREVVEEDELAALRAQQMEYEERRRSKLEELEKLQSRAEMAKAEMDALAEDKRRQSEVKAEPTEEEEAQIEVEEYTQWLNCLVYDELVKKQIAYALLDDIIQSVADAKEEEFCKLWEREMYF